MIRGRLQGLSFRWKLVLAAMVASLVSLALGLAAFVVHDGRTQREAHEAALRAAASVTAENVAAALQFGQPEDAEVILGRLAAQPDIVGAAVHGSDGQRFAARGEPIPPLVLPHAESADAPASLAVGGRLAIIRPVVVGGRNVGSVVVLSSMSTLEARRRETLLGALGVMALALLVSWAISFVLQRELARPIVELAEAARQVSDRHDYGVRVPSPTSGEIGQLTRAFNDMLSGIEARDRELRQARDQAEHSAALQRRAAEQLREGEQRLHALFEGIHDALLVVDAVGRVLDCNDVACRVLGHSREALLGMHASGVVEDGDALSGIGGEGGPRVRESALLARDGRRVPVELSVGDIAYAGRPAVVAVARDLTERRDAEAQRQLLERQLQHAQKLESLGVLAGGIAHDFNNLLTAILGHVSLALARLPVGSEAASHLRLAESATAQAAQLTNQMLAYSGRGRFVVEPMDLSEVVQGIAHLLAASKAKGVALRHALGVGLPRIRGDVAQVRQVVMNLVTNAAESIGERPGTVLLRTWHEVLAAPRSIPLGAQQLAAGPYCVLEVTDEGCGMTADTLDRIFEPFFTTKARGRGLGLAAVLGIMKGHGGALEVWSRPQEGTRFRAWFPASQPETATVAPAPAAASATAAGRGVTLILADDEDAVRTLATRTLRERGHHVLEARDGAEAVELMDAHMPRVGAAVLDLTMPGLGGVETARALRARVPDLPLLFMSGYDDMGETSGIPGTGPCLFLRKPYAPAQLQNAVAELLSRAAPSQPRTDAS